MALNKIRFHHKDGKVVTWTMAKLAAQNETDVPGARKLIEQWLADGDLVRRGDGGFDVIRFRPSKSELKSRNAMDEVDAALRLVKDARTAVKTARVDLKAQHPIVHDVPNVQGTTDVTRIQPKERYL
jgi:hypothetical protein